MAESINILAAIASQWRNSSALAGIPLSSTRIPQGQIAGVGFPYCYFRVSVIRHRFSSAGFRVTNYRVEFHVFVNMVQANNSTLTNTIDTEVAALFDRNLALPVNDNCYVLESTAISDDPQLSEDDYYGEDVRDLATSYRITLSETIPAVYSELAT